MKHCSIVAVFLACAGCASGWTPFELGILGKADGGQLFGSEYSVGGLRLGLASVNKDVVGIDLNLWLGVSNSTTGVAIGLLGLRSDHAVGVAAGWWTHVPRMDGVEVGLLCGPLTILESMDRADVALVVRGAQLGLFNHTQRLHGVQVAPMVNLASSVSGAQVGLVNLATERLDGVQVGLVNRSVGGLQIGLLCFNENGFLPVFPLINF